MTNKQPFTPIFFGDFLASTAEWEGEERALYLLLLCYQWTLGDLPSESTKLAKLIGYDKEHFDKYWPCVKTKFDLVNDRLLNQRLEVHRAKAAEISSKRAAAGANGGKVAQAKFKQMLDKSEAIAPDLLLHPIQSNPIQTNLTKTKKETKNSPASVTDSRFDEIRFAYPKRGGSNRWPEAEKAYKKRLSENHTHEQILDGVKRYANFINLTGRLGTEYVMMASRFLGPNKEFTEAWQPPAEPKAPKILSAAERVQLAMRGEKHERVVSEQTGSGFASLDVLVRDVWK